MGMQKRKNTVRSAPKHGKASPAALCWETCTLLLSSSGFGLLLWACEKWLHKAKILTGGNILAGGQALGPFPGVPLNQVCRKGGKLVLFQQHRRPSRHTSAGGVPGLRPPGV